MLGEASGLACACCWATSSLLLKTQSQKLSALALNTGRAISACFLFSAVVLAGGRVGKVIATPAWVVLALLVSTIIGTGIGGTLYISSISLLGVSRALAISNTYPFFTLILAAAFLGEKVTWLTLLAAIFVAGGVYLLAIPKGKEVRKAESADGRSNLKGVLAGLAAALCWAISSSILKLAIADLDLVVGSFLRNSFLVLFLLSLSLPRGGIREARRAGRRSLAIVGLTGLLDIGVGSFFFLASVQLAGVAKASILTSTAPLLAIPISALVLKEGTSRRMVVGIVLSILGVWLVIL